MVVSRCYLLVGRDVATLLSNVVLMMQHSFNPTHDWLCPLCRPLADSKTSAQLVWLSSPQSAPGHASRPADNPLHGGAATATTTTHHSVTFSSGAASPSAGAVSFSSASSPGQLTLSGSAVLPLRSLIRAVASPSFEQLALVSADGAVVLAGTSCPTSAHGGAGGGGAAATGTLVRAGRASAGSNSDNPYFVGEASGAAGGGFPGLSGAFAGALASGAVPPAVAALAGGGGGGGGGSGGDSPRSMSSRTNSKSGMLVATGYAARGAPVAVMEVARFHRGRVAAALWLSPTRLVTGGGDGTVRMWRCVGRVVCGVGCGVWARGRARGASAHRCVVGWALELPEALSLVSTLPGFVPS